MKKLGLITVTLLSSLVMYAKQFTVYYRDMENKNRGIWLYNTGDSNKDNKFYLGQKEGNYYKFMFEANENSTPKIIFVKGKSNINEPDWDANGSKDLRLRNDDGHEDLTKQTLYFHAETSVVLEYNIDEFIMQKNNLNEKQKDKLYKLVGKKKNNYEIELLKREINKVNEIVIIANDKVNDLKSEISKIPIEKIVIEYNKRAEKIKNRIDRLADTGFIKQEFEQIEFYKDLTIEVKKLVNDIESFDMSREDKEDIYDNLKKIFEYNFPLETRGKFNEIKNGYEEIKNNSSTELEKEKAILIRAVFITENLYIDQKKMFKEKIDNAKSLEEVKSIKEYFKEFDVLMQKAIVAFEEFKEECTRIENDTVRTSYPGGYIWQNKLRTIDKEVVNKYIPELKRFVSEIIDEVIPILEDVKKLRYEPTKKYFIDIIKWLRLDGSKTVEDVKKDLEKFKDFESILNRPSQIDDRIKDKSEENIRKVRQIVSKYRKDMTSRYIEKKELEKMYNDVMQYLEETNTEDLEAKKKSTIEEIKKLVNLSEEQRKEFISMITNKNTVNEIEALREKITDIDTKMLEVKEELNNLNEEIKRLKDEEKRNFYVEKHKRWENSINTITHVFGIDQIIIEIQKLIEKIKNHPSYTQEIIDDKKDEILKEIDESKISAIQKDKLKKDLKKVKKIKELDKVKEDFNKLKSANKNLDDLISKNEKLLEKSDDKNKEKVKELIKKAKEDADMKVDANKINEITKSLREKLAKLVVNLKNKKYKEVANAFYYTNHDLFNKLKDNIYFDIKFNQHILNDYDSLGGITIGGNYEFKNIGLKLGAFTEYDNNKAHNVSLGTAIFYDDFSSFVRYRLAILKKDGYLLNHNLDILAKYSHKFEFNKLNVEPLASIYATVSSKTKIDDYVTLKPRFGFDLSLGTKIAYDALDNLNIFTTPSITVGYNNQKLYNELSKETEKIERSYFNYAIDFGIKYTKNNFVIEPILKLNGDMKKNLNFGAKFAVGYNF